MLTMVYTDVITKITFQDSSLFGKPDIAVGEQHDGHTISAIIAGRNKDALAFLLAYKDGEDAPVIASPIFTYYGAYSIESTKS